MITHTNVIDYDIILTSCIPKRVGTETKTPTDATIFTGEDTNSYITTKSRYPLRRYAKRHYSCNS